MLPLQHTPPLQSTTPGLHPVSIHQMAPPVQGSKHLITAYYSVYRPRKDERPSRPGWLITYRNKVPPPGVKPGHVTHPSTNRVRRRVTSLIRPMPLPLRHAANHEEHMRPADDLYWMGSLLCILLGTLTLLDRPPSTLHHLSSRIPFRNKRGKNHHGNCQIQIHLAKG